MQILDVISNQLTVKALCTLRVKNPNRMTALAAGQAAAVAHVTAHELGAAAYAIRAAMCAVPKNEVKTARQKECAWQREQLHKIIQELVLDDEHMRNNLCWFVFEGKSDFPK